MSAQPEDRHDADYESDVSEEGTTPPISRPDILSEPRIHSTPQSKGTAEQSELHYNMRTKTAQNIENVKHDLRNTAIVDFAAMVKAIAYCGTFKPSNDVDQIKKGFEARKAQIDSDYEKILREAIELCDSDLSMPKKVVERTPNQLLCRAIKTNIKKFCGATTEKERYVPLVNVLNAILSFINHNPQMIFVVNDPMLVQSDHLPAKSKRKPDIIKVSLKTFKRWLRLPDDTDFNTCQVLAANRKIKIFEKPYWIDVGQFWELKLGRSLSDLVTTGKEKTTFRGEDFSTSKSVPGYSTALSGNTVGAESSALKRKRADDEEDAESRKRPQKQPKAAGGQIMPPLSEVPTVDNDVQCGYYATERFRATWQITHVSGVLLTANFLTLLWYDPQGCIQSSRIDIVRQLPLLVLLVTMQQQSDFWLGWPPTEIPPKYRMVHKCAPRFQLVGRMTSCAEVHAVDSSTKVSGTKEAEHYFKSSWPEDDRVKEHIIVATAKIRAGKLLLPEFQGFVLEHLPEINVTAVVQGSCTAIIRVLLDLPTEGCRTQYLMISKKLSSVRNIVNDTSFKRVFLEIIRAHRLLWVLGIAHGNISFHNLMLDGDKGILNDFDLASIMKPGDPTPPEKGRRCTGTSMFMPLELLIDPGVEGLVPRVYHHELESFAWVLLYATLCVDHGEENLNVSPFRDWVRLNSTELGEHKSAFILMGTFHIRKLVRDPYQKVLLSTFHVWRDLLNKQEEASYYQTSTPSLPSDESLLTQVVAALGFSHDKWIDFKISPTKDTPPTMASTMASTTGSTVIAEDLVEYPSSTSALPVVCATVAGGWVLSQGPDDHEDI